VIIDTHAHIFPETIVNNRQHYLNLDATFNELYSGNGAYLATAEDLIEEMDKAQVDLTIIVGIGWCDLELAKMCNDYFTDAVRKYPTRLRFFCAANPNWGDQALYEIERCAQNGAIGVGELHPSSQNLNITDRSTMRPFSETINHLNMKLLTHSSEPVGHLYPGKGHTTPNLLAKFLEIAGSLNVICAHLGGGLPFYSHMPEIRAQLANAMFDTAATPFLYDPSVLKTVSEASSPQQILFGSDYPLMSQRRALKYVRQSGLSRDTESMILGTNAMSIYNLSEY
jgi:hypothetical protein